MAVMKKSNKLLFAIGFIVLTAVSIIFAPKVIEWLSDKFYKNPEFTEEDDWDPVIVKKQKGKDTEDGEL